MERVTDFGEPNLIVNSILTYRSTTVPSQILNFRKKSQNLSTKTGKVNEYWLCVECEKIRKQRVGIVEDNETYCTIIVSDNRILKDPEIGHCSYCPSRRPPTLDEINAAKNRDREEIKIVKTPLDKPEERKNFKNGEKRPREACSRLNSSETNKRFAASLNAADACRVQRNLQKYKSMKAVLNRLHHRKSRPTISSIDSIEEILPPPIQPPQEIKEDLKKLFQLALNARLKAYNPYSKFRVGAALVCDDGSVYTGCNVENASFGLCICAERTAIVKAVSDGKVKFKCIVVASDLTSETAFPCGSCRQFMIEFGNYDVYCVSLDGETYKKTSCNELLPNAFTPNCLLKYQEEHS